MAEAITIPSPSAFLRVSPAPSSPPPAKTRDAPKEGAKEKKKAQPRKPSVAAASAVNSNPNKPKQSKSRNGCVTCKAKRLKCGEEKPGCQQCKRRNVECGGYKKDFKWRPFEETNVKVNIDRQKRASPPIGQASADSSKPTTPTSETTPGIPATSSTNTTQGHKRKDSKRPNEINEDLQARSLPARPAKATRSKQRFSDEEAKSASPPEPPPAPEPEPEPEPDPRSEQKDVGTPLTVPVTNASLQEISAQVAAPIPGLSPTLSEILRPFADGEQPEDDGSFVNFTLPEGMSFPLTPSAVIDPALINGSIANGELEDFGQADEPFDMPVFSAASSERQSPTRSRPNTSSSLSPRDVAASWQGPVGYLYSQPYFAQDSPEMLAFRFDKLTCGILSIMDGPNENPWRTLIWPLAQQSPALYHAVTAMTAYHSATDVPSLRVVGHEHKQASIRYIQEGISNRSMTDQTAIATALALGFSESWDQHTATGNTHIKGAQALVKRTMADHQRNPLGGIELARLKFLCNAWVYMDVIARLTSVDSDESNDFDNTFLFSNEAPNMIMGDSGIGFGIDFGMPIDARLDPLMGCGGTLFPLIGRVANLVRKVCRSQSNSPGVISQAHDLKLALELWEPPEFIERPEDPTTDVQHTLQTAEAYRWATLLHLHQSVPELPSDSSGELAQRVLQYLATVPLASRTVIVQIYPLMVAGCEATTAEDRQWVRSRWSAMGQRMRIGVIDKSATVTEEVWRRKDAYEAQPTTRRKLVATADLQPVRQRGSPLVRTNTGFRESDPGRTGMVFSYVEAEENNGAPVNERFPKRRTPTRPMGNVDTAYTVRGHLHWVGVMWDWGWEILLG